MIFRDSKDSSEASIEDCHCLGLPRPLAQKEEVLNVLYRSESLLPELQITCHLHTIYEFIFTIFICNKISDTLPPDRQCLKMAFDGGRELDATHSKTSSRCQNKSHVHLRELQCIVGRLLTVQSKAVLLVYGRTAVDWGKCMFKSMCSWAWGKYDQRCLTFNCSNRVSRNNWRVSGFCRSGLSLWSRYWYLHPTWLCQLFQKEVCSPVKIWALNDMRLRVKARTYATWMNYLTTFKADAEKTWKTEHVIIGEDLELQDQSINKSHIKPCIQRQKILLPMEFVF